MRIPWFIPSNSPEAIAWHLAQRCLEALGADPSEVLEFKLRRIVVEHGLTMV